MIRLYYCDISYMPIIYFINSYYVSYHMTSQYITWQTGLSSHLISYGRLVYHIISYHTSPFPLLLTCLLLASLS